MSSLPFSTGVPLDWGWFAIWIAIPVILLPLLKYLGDQDQEKRSNELALRRFPTLNDYLYHITNDNTPREYIISVEDLLKLLGKVRGAGRPVIDYRRLRRHKQFGYLACAVAIFVGAIFLSIYEFEFQWLEWANILSVICVLLLDLWAIWHFANVCWSHYKIDRVSDED